MLVTVNALALESVNNAPLLDIVNSSCVLAPAVNGTRLAGVIGQKLFAPVVVVVTV